MLTKCEHCGEEAVDDSESHEVCGACGIVVEGAKFDSYVPPSSSSSAGLFFAPYQKYGSRTQQRVQQSRPRVSLKHGLAALDNLCHVFSVDGACREETVDLFTKVCSERHFGHREGAAVTAACCLFLVQRKNKKSLPMSALCHEIQATKGKFSHYLKSVKSWLSSNGRSRDIHASSGDGGAEDDDAASEANVSESLEALIRLFCGKVEGVEKVAFQKKTSELVKLASSCWLLTGRSPKSVVVACTYLCWKSMHRSNMRTSFEAFCSNFDIRDSMAKLRIPELKAMLLKLGQHLPSLASDYVTKQNVLYHLGSILENSETLRYDLFPDTTTRETVEKTEFAAFRVPSKTPKRKESESAVRYDPDMNASDIEISDTEIETYLVSDKKKKFMELCKADT